MKTIFRYRLPITDTPAIEMPVMAEVLSVGPPRDGSDLLDLWAMVDTNRPTKILYEFRIVGTGHPMPEDVGRFVGSVTTHSGAFVWHVFEVA